MRLGHGGAYGARRRGHRLSTVESRAGSGTADRAGAHSLANEPILKRPIAINLVQLALPEACKHDKALCIKVKKYLERYSRDYAVTHASATGTIHNGADGIVPNGHGEPLQSAWEASAQGFVQPNDHFLISAGVIAYDGRTRPTGTMLSMGFNWAQLDIGYRDHWWSPATDSTMMIGTEAPTMPSVTLSNYEPLTRLGFQYELFLAQMASSDRIWAGARGRPRKAGAIPSSSGRNSPSNLSAAGRSASIGSCSTAAAACRIRSTPCCGISSSPRHRADAGQPTGLVRQPLHFPAKVPFAFYVQYAGENTLNGGSYLLGESALTTGIDFPKLGRYFDLTYEISEWQNAWYVNSVFLDGMTNDGIVLGNWGADQRIFNDGVGARSQMLRLGWEPPFGGYLEERVRTVANQSYGAYPYQHYVDLTVRYSRPWNDATVGGEVLAGRDVFGKSFSRISGFVRYGGTQHTRSYESEDDDEDSAAEPEDKNRTEMFIDAGANANKVRTDLQKGLPITTSNRRLRSARRARGTPRRLRQQRFGRTSRIRRGAGSRTSRRAAGGLPVPLQ